MTRRAPEAKGRAGTPAELAGALAGTARGLLCLALPLLLALSRPLAADFKILGGNILNQKGVSLGVDFDHNGTNDLVFDPARRVGLLTPSPSANLHVAGNMLIDDYLLLAPLASPPTVDSGNVALFTQAGNLYYKDTSRLTSITGSQDSLWSAWLGNIYVSSGLAGIGSASPSANLDVAGTANITDRLLLGDGSADAPALAFTGDPDTGLYLGAAGNVCLALDGTHQISIMQSVLGSGNGIMTLHGLDLKSDRHLQSDYNLFLGAGSGKTGLTGTYNIGLGVRANENLTNGQRNTAMGYVNLSAGVPRNDNTVMAYNGMNWGAFQNCTAVGYDSQRSGTTPNGTGLGQGSVGYDGGYNTGAGYFALAAAGTSNNTGVGYYACYSMKSSSGNNTGFGQYVMRTVSVSGNYNTGFGQRSLYNLTSGERNAMIGDTAGSSMTTGGNNVGVGAQSGNLLTTGANNVLLGCRSGYNLTTGSNDIIVGWNRDALNATDSDVLNLNGVIMGNLLTGDIGIGTSAPSGNLHVGGNMVCGNILPLGNVMYSLGTSASSWSAVYARDMSLISDRRLKAGIAPVPDGTGKLARLNPVRFRWKDGGGERIGFLAQEVEQVVPEAVPAGLDPERLRGLRQEALVPVVVQAIREQAGRCEQDLAKCRRRVSELHERNRALLEAIRALREGR